jgi:hypothetical protein
MNWKGGEFGGRPVCGATLLRFDQTGLIAGVTLLHAPLGKVLTCSAFLSQ